MLGSKNENDDWFMIRHEKLKALHQEMSQTLESFKAVTKSKDTLRGKSADVKEILSTILAGFKTHFCYIFQISLSSQFFHARKIKC